MGKLGEVESCFEVRAHRSSLVREKALKGGEMMNKVDECLSKVSDQYVSRQFGKIKRMELGYELLMAHGLDTVKTIKMVNKYRSERKLIEEVKRFVEADLKSHKRIAP